MMRLPERLEHLSHFPHVTRQLDTLRLEMELLVTLRGHATLVRTWAGYGLHADRYVPLSLQPILGGSHISAGIAVGWHSVPLDVDLPPELEFAEGRFLMGRLIHGMKGYSELSWTGDDEDVQEIGHLAACALLSTNAGQHVDLMVTVPSSRGTNDLPFRIARDVSFLTGRRYAPSSTITFQRHVPQIKEVTDYWSKRDVLHRSMQADAEVVQGRAVLIVDDVCRSGATLHEAARACHEAGATRIMVMAISKTFTFQRIPQQAPESTFWRRAVVQ